jgi:hypothetical protein
MFPLREVPIEPGEVGFLIAPLTRNLKKQIKPLLEDPLGLA